MHVGVRKTVPNLGQGFDQHIDIRLLRLRLRLPARKLVQFLRQLLGINTGILDGPPPNRLRKSPRSLSVEEIHQPYATPPFHVSNIEVCFKRRTDIFEYNRLPIRRYIEMRRLQRPRNA